MHMHTYTHTHTHTYGHSTYASQYSKQLLPGSHAFPDVAKYTEATESSSLQLFHLPHDFTLPLHNMSPHFPLLVCSHFIRTNVGSDKDGWI